MTKFKFSKYNSIFPSIIFVILMTLTLTSCMSSKKIVSSTSHTTSSKSYAKAKNIKNNIENNKSAQNNTIKAKNSTIDSSITISAVGDCTLGTDPSFNQATSLPAVVRKNGNSKYYLFKNVSSIFKKDDITIANLETTFTNSNNKQVKKFTFKGDPSLAASIPAASIDGVNISNNHIHDFGVQGFNDTITTLKKYKINYFGEGSVWKTKCKNVKVVFLGYTGWSNNSYFLSKLKSDIHKYKTKNNLVIVTFHWGIEYTYKPNAVQTNIAHTAIDAGANFVIGHHPHVLESVEKYKGKYICYSLSNFCFGGNSNPPDKDSMIFQSKFYFKNKKLIANKVRVIPCSISSVSAYNNYCPTPLTGYNRKRVLNKINKLNINMNFKLGTKFK